MSVKLEIIKISSEFVAGFSNFAEEKRFDGNDIGESLNPGTTKGTKVHEGRTGFGVVIECGAEVIMDSPDECVCGYVAI